MKCYPEDIGEFDMPRIYRSRKRIEFCGISKSWRPWCFDDHLEEGFCGGMHNEEIDMPNSCHECPYRKKGTQ